MCLEKLKLVVGTEDGQHPVPEEPGGVDAEEAAGCHQWQWQPHQVLACQAVRQWALFRAKIVSIRDLLTYF